MNKELLLIIYNNLIKKEDYDNAEYIVNLINDNKLRDQFDKSRMQQGEFIFGKISHKLFYLSKIISKD